MPKVVLAANYTVLNWHVYLEIAVETRRIDKRGPSN